MTLSLLADTEKLSYLVYFVGYLLLYCILHVCMYLLHSIQDEDIQLLLFCTKTSNRCKQSTLQWIVSTFAI